MSSRARKHDEVYRETLLFFAAEVVSLTNPASLNLSPVILWLFHLLFVTYKRDVYDLKS